MLYEAQRPSEAVQGKGIRVPPQVQAPPSPTYTNKVGLASVVAVKWGLHQLWSYKESGHVHTLKGFGIVNNADYFMELS